MLNLKWTVFNLGDFEKRFSISLSCYFNCLFICKFSLTLELMFSEQNVQLIISPSNPK